MNPILFENSIISIDSLLVTTALGFVIALNYFFINVKRRRLQIKALMKHQWLLIIGSIIAARIGAIIENWNFFQKTNFWQTSLQIISIWDKEFNLFSGIVFFLIVAVISLKQAAEEVYQWTDIFTFSLLIVFFFNALGSFLDGQHYGRETDLPWGIILDNFNVQYTVPIHPTQLYNAISALIIFLALYYGQNRLPFLSKTGNITIIGLASYSLAKFLEIFWRGDEVLTIFSIRLDQILSSVLIILGIVMFIYHNHETKSRLQLYSERTEAALNFLWKQIKNWRQK